MHMVLAIWLNGQPRSTVRYCGTVHARFAPACPSAFFASMAHAQCESTAFHVRCCTLRRPYGEQHSNQQPSKKVVPAGLEPATSRV